MIQTSPKIVLVKTEVKFWPSALLIKCLVCTFLLCSSINLFAKHGKGGFIVYQYLGPGSSAGTSKYQITVRHYIDCNSAQLIEAQVYLGIFDAGTNSLVKTVTVAKSSQQYLQKTSFNSCIHPAPDICFYVVTYITAIELTDNIGGYTLADQDCCRINDIINIVNSVNYGITNTNTIPGVINNVVYRNNSSPVFIEKDTAVICFNSYFTLEMTATDTDGDSLAYAFYPAKSGASMQDHQPNPPASPPYGDLPYASGYSALAPLGSKVTIDAAKGIISGTAPATTGTYVLSVAVYEYRNGVLIGTTKKEVHVTVADCSLTGASLKPQYINCTDYSFSFENESTSSNITSYTWDFGVTNTGADTSSQPTPTYTYKDTGTFQLKLTVSSSAGCKDSAASTVFVYPGFTPAFTFTGSCYQSPFQFIDASSAAYGFISSWSWNLGDTTVTQQNISHTYLTAGQYTVTLNVSSSKGCTGTVAKLVTANDKPQIILPFTDTLICSIDTLRLIANSSGTYSWSPAYNIIGSTTSAPLVYPKDTTVYTVTVRDKQCIDSSSIKVNVLDKITVELGNDITICKTDSVQLKPITDGLQFLWSPATGLSNTFIKNPDAAPLNNQQYNLMVNLGKCNATDSINIRVVAYPAANAGPGDTLCYGETTTLKGNITGAYFTWSPVSSLTNYNSLTPVASPLNTTTYILSVTDTLGCTKPGLDSVTILVIPKIPAFAGNDTVVVANQPLQLNATGASFYAWSPATGMNNLNIANPVVILSASYDSIIYTVQVSTAEGCYADDDVKVKVFKTLPDIFVPTAFTPNADGRNDIIKPILVGMKQLSFFRIFNRWGQLLFSTTEIGKGWNGTVNGVEQSTGTYVFMASGIDYTGKTILRKGTLVLLR